MGKEDKRGENKGEKKRKRKERKVGEGKGKGKKRRGHIERKRWKLPNSNLIETETTISYF